MNRRMFLPDSRSRASRLLAIGLVACAIGLLPAESPESNLRFERRAEGYIALDAGRPVLFYQLEPKSLNGRSKRVNYVHPLYGLDGEILTEDFPADHIHHRGVFWAWHQVLVNGRKMGDSWLAQDFLARVVQAEPVSGGSGAALRVRAEWVSPALIDTVGKQQTFLDEVTTVRVQPAERDLRKIDFEISLTPLVDGLSLGGSEDDKGYGGFSVRARLPEDLRFLAPRGPLTPRRTALPASAWVDLTASFSGKEERRPAGIAILSHPSVPGFPQPWILRSQTSMQNPVWPGRHAVALPRGKPLIFRYRLVVHRGELSRDRVERLQREYEREE